MLHVLSCLVGFVVDEKSESDESESTGKDVSMGVKTEDSDGADKKSMLKQVLLDPNQPTGGDTASAEKVHVCPYCNYSSPNEMRIRAHVITQHTQCPKKVSCPLCQEDFTDRPRLEKHLMQTHNVTAEGMQRLLLMVEQPEWFPPAPPAPVPPHTSQESDTGNENNNTAVGFDIADDDTDRPVEADDGTGDASSEFGEEYRCQMCSKTFMVIDALYTHQNELGHLKMQQTPRGPGYLCWKKGCNQYFSTPQALQVHFREIHAKRQQLAVSERHIYKYRCNQCSLAFKTIEKLQLHSQYHIIRAATKCSLCGRGFRSIAALQKHIETAHVDMSVADLEQYRAMLATSILQQSNQEVKQEVEEGELIDDGQVENEDVEANQDEDSMDTPSEPEPGEYKDAQFLEDYMNSQAIAEDSYNDPNRKFKCHKCKLAFTKQSYLTSHNKTLLHRKGEKMTYPMEKYMDPNRPYKCDVCKESFTQKNILLVHYNSVSHLHKLRRSTLEKESSPSSPEADKKPYKCNICKVAYSQGSTLDIHMRSVLHQTRASKLQELAITGQVDLSCPLIETPETQKTQSRQQQQQKEEQEHRKLLTEMLTSKQSTVATTSAVVTSASASGTESTQSSPSSLTTTATNTTVGSYLPPLMTAAGGLVSFPMTNLTSQIAQPPVLFPHQQVFTCNRCNSMFVNQESLLQHQKLFCYFQQPGQPSPNNKAQATTAATTQNTQASQPTQTYTPTHTDLKQPLFVRRTKPSMHKQLLQSYGFEIVMQFNEYHQRRKKRLEKQEEAKEDEEALLDIKKETELKPDLTDESNKVETVPELEEKKPENENEAADSKEEAKDELKVVPPELNECECPKCQKKFSSIWVLKAHREEMHGEIVPLKSVQEYSEVFRSEFEKVLQQQQQQQQEGTATTSEGTPTSETPPASSSAAPTQEQVQQGLLSGMDIGQFSHQMFNFGFNFGGFPLNMNMSMLAAMNLHPPLMMMPPHMDPLQQGMSQMGQDFMPAPQPAGSSMLSGQEQKRARTRINDEQLKVLRAHFDINNSPSEDQIIGMSEKTGLPPKVIKHWFRNTLFKERQRNKDSPYNFNNPPSTTLNLEEYERTGDINMAMTESKVRAAEKKIQHSLVKSERHSNDASCTDQDRSSHAASQPCTPAPTLQASTSNSVTNSTPVTSATSVPLASSTIASSSINCMPIAQANANTATSSRLAVQTSTPHSTHQSMFIPSTTVSPPVSSSPPVVTTMPPPAQAVDHRSPDTNKRANRTRFSDFQIKNLQEYFEQNAYPKDDDLDRLSKLLNLSPRVIVVWFQNARQKARKTYENQPAPEDDEMRYKRTPGLNYQCKKCMLVFQRYYELIKHQKTACYKDDINKPSVSDSYSYSTYSESSQGSNGSIEKNIENVSTSETHIKKENTDANFRCEKCHQVFQRFEQWREHQNVHLMNPSLFSSFSPETPFGQLQNYNTKSSTKRRADDSFNEEDIEDGQTRDKRLRTTILPEQLDYLYQQYQIDSNPSRKMLENIAQEVRLKKRVVQVWFQNTRARERKGQFRSHHQAIHKRCPFCRALFKARSALESHLATKHADQVSRCEINIDAIPNAEPEALERPSFADFSDISSAFSGGVGSNPVTTFPVTSAPEQLQDTMKRFYEDSLKRYLDELSSPSHKKDQDLGMKIASSLSEGGETPLDLSKPIRLSIENNIDRPSESAPLTDNSEVSFNDSSFKQHGDDRSETFSETQSLGDDSISGDANPNSPNSSTGSRNNQSKRYRTQMSNMQIKVMKCLFADYKTPTMTECEMLGKEIGLPKRVVQVWFQNARAKEKKNKLAFAKQFGQELDLNHRPPEECKLCSFKYSHKYTIQDHIFTRKHIDNVVKCVQGQEHDVGSFPESASTLASIMRQQECMSEATAFAAQNQMAQQLQAIAGLQSLGIPPSALAGLSSPPTTTSSSSATPAAEVRPKSNKVCF